MAQLAAIENALYYPTPTRVIQLFREKHLSLAYSRGLAFDPCCGEGSALKALFDGVVSCNVKTAGIELEKKRASEAVNNLDFAYHGAFEDFDIETEIGFIFMNPPYDTANGERVEITWINMVAPLLPKGKSMMLVLPERFVEGGVDEGKLILALYKNGLTLIPASKYIDRDQVGAFKFPEPEYNDFKQYILVVYKPYSRPDRVDRIHVEGVVGEVDRRINSVELSDRVPDTFDVVKSKKKYETKITEQELIDLFGQPTEQIPVTPLQSMRPEMTAAIIAGGMFSGVEMGNKVVRGGVKIKHVTTIQQTHNATEEIVTQKMIAKVSELDMETGDVVVFDSETDEDAFGERIEKIAHKLQAVLDEKNPCIFDREKDLARLSRKFELVHAPRVIDGKQNGLFPTQIEAAATVLRGWEMYKTVFLSGEMGVGKTITSIAAAIGRVKNKKSDAQNIVILLPSKNDLVEKWEEEIRLSCRDLNIEVFDVRTIPDVQRAFAHKGITVILVKESMVKRTSGWSHIWLNKGKCFNCGKKAQLLNSDGEFPERNDETLYCDQCGIMHRTDVRNDRGKGDAVDTLKEYMQLYYSRYKWKNNDEKREAMRLVKRHAEQFKYTQYGNSGNAYYPLAKYILKHYSGTYVLVEDEAHQYKGGDSARGYASHQLIIGADRVLKMTGTFYNGYASSIFFQLYRANANFRKLWDYDSVNDFVALYGLQQKVTKVYNSSEQSTWSGYTKKPSVRVKEIPGIHPAMIATMLPFTVFMKLSDLDVSLPPQHSATLFMDVPETPKKLINNYLSNINAGAQAEMKEDGSMSLMGSLTWARGGAFDAYPIGDQIYDKDDKSKIKYSLSPIQPEKLAPKEEAVIRLVLKHRNMGFPSVIGYLQADRRPIQDRLIKLFEDYGLKLVYMPSTVKSRVPFVKAAFKDGADAIITNPNLMREGIDLLMINATIWMSAVDDAVLVNQFNARSNRIGQTHETYVYYLGYNETYQAEQWTRTAKKVAAMQAMHGDVRTGISALLGDMDLIATVQNHLLTFERYESDMTMDDLPPLEKVVTTQKPKKAEGWYSFASWAEDKGVDIKDVKPRSRKVIVPDAQIAMFERRGDYDTK